MDYSNLTEIERIIMGIFNIFSLFVGIPIAIRLIKQQKTRFPGLIQMMAIFTSAMYHLSEVLNTPILVEELQWHRLDNIFAQVCFGTVFMKILGVQLITWPLKLFLFVAVVTQLIDPWNFSYTLFPIIGQFLFSLVLRIKYYPLFQVNYNYYNIAMFSGLLSIGIYNMVLGLDQNEDYLRINHGLWHFFSGMSVYYLFDTTTVRLIQQKNR